MKVQQVFTKRGKSLIAATGIAAVVMFNGFGGGLASANQAPPETCEFAPSAQSGTGAVTGSSAGEAATASLPGSGGTTTNQGSGAPAESETASESTAGGSGAVTSDAQVVQVDEIDLTESCAVQGSMPSQSVGVDVCVSGSDLAVTNISPTTEAVPSTGSDAVPGAGTGANSSAVHIDPNAPQTVPGAGAQSGTVDAGSLEITQVEGGVMTSIEDAPGVSITEGVAVASTGSTCVSVTVTDGSTSIDITTEAGAAAQSGGANAPGAGQSATGEVAPTQPGVTNGAPTQPGTQTTPQLDPKATPPAPGQ
jgi:hypothetical protein